MEPQLDEDGRTYFAKVEKVCARCGHTVTATSKVEVQLANLNGDPEAYVLAEHQAAFAAATQYAKHHDCDDCAKPKA